MKLRGITSAAVLALSFGCGDKGTESEQTFLDFSTAAVVGGDSSLTRFEDDKKVEGTGTATNLTAGNIHTVWAVIFNFSSKCSAPNCGLEDIGPTLPVEADLMRVDFGTPGSDGTLAFDFTLLQGMTHVEGSTLASDFNFGLKSIDDSEIHFVVVDHGPPGALGHSEAAQRAHWSINGAFKQFAPHYGLTNTTQTQTPGGHAN